MWRAIFSQLLPSPAWRAMIASHLGLSIVLNFLLPVSMPAKLSTTSPGMLSFRFT
jgi:hypothetical protein